MEPIADLDWLLTALVFAPLAGALLMALVPQEEEELHKRLALRGVIRRLARPRVVRGRARLYLPAGEGALALGPRRRDPRLAVVRLRELIPRPARGQRPRISGRLNVGVGQGRAACSGARPRGGGRGGARGGCFGLLLGLGALELRVRGRHIL